MLDPCFGGGVFLRSACRRLLQLGGQPERQVFGVEIDPNVHQPIRDKLALEFDLNRGHIRHADFFSVEPIDGERVDAVIGNPPFIRYQRFTGEARRLGLARSMAQGVRLPELCSSWAPFIVHCIAMLRPGGRLAMVLPMEVGHAKYARPVLEHIRRSFGAATFLTFRKKLFPELNEDTLLLLADEKGASCSKFLSHDLAAPTPALRDSTAERVDPSRLTNYRCRRNRLRSLTAHRASHPPKGQRPLPGTQSVDKGSTPRIARGCRYRIRHRSERLLPSRPG